MPSGPVAGAVILSSMFFTSLIGSVVLLPPALLLLPFPAARPVFHWWASLVAQQWFLFVAFLLEWVGGVRYRVWAPGGGPLRHERTFIICNHRTRIDWMMAWGMLARFPAHLARLKIALKSDLKFMPGFGWAMQYFRFMYIDREKPEQALTDMDALCRYFNATADVPTPFIFPEGTDLHPKAVEKSNEYAERKGGGAPKLRYVLYPRPKGTRVLLNGLRGSMDAVWDCTIAYKDHTPGERPSEKDLAMGRFPKEVHFHVMRCGVGEVPHGEAEFRDWVDGRFVMKDRLLAPFYPPPTEAPAPDAEVGFRDGSLEVPLPPPTLRYAGAVAFWVVSGSAWVRHLSATWWVPLHALLLISAYVYAKRKGGVDTWLILPPPTKGGGKQE